MEAVLNSQDRLNNIEQRILNLSQDNNLIKNMADLSKSKK